MSWQLTVPVVLLALGLACQVPEEAPARPAPAAITAPAKEVALPAYTAERPVSGELKSVGSDSMEPLMTLWGEDFKKFHPRVTTLFICKGSGTAPKALIEGSSLIGHMSREMNDQEIAAFQAKFGYTPTRIPVAGKVAWITPAGAQGGKVQGIGVHLNSDEAGVEVRRKIEGLLGGTLTSNRPTHTL